MKIVVLDGYTLNPGDLHWDGFRAMGDLTVYDITAKDQILDRIGDAEIVITNKTPLTRETFTQAPNIRYVGVLATGYNVVDVAAAAEHHIVVTNIPTYGTDAVSQYAFALLLELCHHVGDHGNAVRRGDWSKSEHFCFWNYPLVELAGKTMGVIGYGRIGKRTAAIAYAFGMSVLAYDTHSDSDADYVKMVDLQELLERSDVISLHCPLFENTRGIINRRNIAMMKDDVMIINTSRGPLIEEADLAEALKSGKVAGAAVDVVSTEPPTSDNPLLHAPNCIVTPHIAWAPKESRQRLMNIAVENLAAFLRGEEVNKV